MAELLGGQVDALRAQNFRHLASWRHTALLSEADATLQDGHSRQVDMAVLSTFGKQVHAIVTLSRVDRGGQPHLLLIAQDVTSQRKIHDALVAARDSAQDVARTKSAFLANMSHEIRTPMNAIVGLSRLALEDHLPPKSRDYLGKVHSSALALMEILDEVLDYSKIEAGQMRVESIPMDLQDVLRRVTDLFCGRIEQKGLILNTTMASDVPHWVMGDPLRLTQIINNLVGNAVKFTDSGSISITIDRMHEATTEVDLLRFCVKDTGMGIAPECQSTLFDAFTQADTSITRRFGGTGLGLTICKSLVTMMSGRIGVCSELGGGSEFWFALPMTATDAPARAPSQVDRHHSSIREEEASTVTELEKLRNRRVLLAEDNRLNQMVATEFLTRMGLEVTVVDNGLEALDTIKGVAPDHFAAILMDLHMPVMDGLESTRRIRALPGREHTPIIAMTAAALDEDRSACMGVGMVDHIPKPVMPEQLLKVLLRWMTPEQAAEAMAQEAPPMPGFDLPGLSERVHGNERLMWLLLAQLAEQEAPSGDLLAQLMAQGDIEAARQRAHDIKGCAANLGAQALSDASARLESALKQGRLDHEALAAFQHTLNESMACIRAHLAWRTQAQAQTSST
jgi:signal transduction histidine kinase/CheY-like chemotaxis protein/HPt (histidine-containing phosphotransfer) domain-containing protein